MLFSKKLTLLLPWKRRARELTLEEELQSHIELAAADALKEGAAPDEAMLAGRRDLGNTLLIQEDARTLWGFTAWDHFLQDLRFGVRQCKRQPGFTAVAIFTFALGAGANALMFTVVDSVLLRPLPYPDAHQLVSLDSIDAKGSHGSTSLPNFLSLRKYAQSFSGLTVYQEKSVSLRLPGGEPVHAAGIAASANLFDVLRVGPILGRTFLAEEDQPGKSCIVVLSTGFWREHFSSDPRILGQYLTVDGKTCRVSGVMPAHFAFPSRDVGFWMPFQPTSDMAQRGAQFLDVIGRLKPDVTLAAAQNELKVLAQRLEKAFPGENKGKRIGVQLYRDTLTGDVRPALLLLLASVAVLLLIACANIANLQLARALGRKREMAIRAALGAGRLRVARQLLTENLMLAFAGSGIGLALAAGSLDLLKRLGANAIPRVHEIALRPEVCLAMLMVASISAVLFGLAPIWQTARQDIETALRESATSASGGRRQQQFRDLLVVAQLTFAVVLLAGSGLLLRGLYRLLHTDRGFTAEHVLTLQTAMSGMELAGKNIAAAIYSPELDAIERIPGVKAAGFITFLPLSNGHATASFLIKGTQDLGPDARPRVSLNAASDDFFRALQIPLLAGRFFAKTDTLGKPRVAIVNDILAHRYFAGQDPIGKQIAFDDPDFQSNPITIIGVVAGSRQIRLAIAPDAELYLNFRQVPPVTLWSEFLLKQIMTYVVRSSGDPAAIVTEVQRAIRRVDPEQTVFHVATMQEIVSASVEGRRLAALLLSVLAGLAIVVAAAGLYGVLSYLISQKRRDIAVRMALGARKNDVLWMLVSRALVLYGVGAGCGLLGVIWFGRLLSNMLAGIRPWDPSALGITTAVLLVIVVLAAWLPARRAAFIDPCQVLRSE